MAWGMIAAYVAIGAVLGFIVGRLSVKSSAQSDDVKAQLDKTQSELNQHREAMVNHFSNSAELLENIYRDYSKLCQIMAKSSTDLLPEQAEQDNPFAKRLAHALETNPVVNDSIALQEAPRDYSETQSGLLKGEEEKPAPLAKEEKKEATDKVE